MNMTYHIWQVTEKGTEMHHIAIAVKVDNYKHVVGVVLPTWGVLKNRLRRKAEAVFYKVAMAVIPLPQMMVT
jgi:hypothetical protein